MEPTIWVAFIAVGGVLVGSMGPWMTSRSTNRATQLREEAVRQDNQRRLDSDYAEKAKVREHEVSMQKRAAQAAVSEAWREKRLVAHRTALAAANHAFAAVERYQKAWSDDLQINRPQLPDNSVQHPVDASTPEVELLGSTASSQALRRFTSKLGQILRAFAVNDFITHGSALDDEAKQSYLERVVDLGEALMAYQAQAKMDLGTME